MSYIIRNGQCIFEEGTKIIYYSIRESHRNIITSLIIPASVESIYPSAFEGCLELTSIKVSPDNKVYDSREDCNAIIDTQSNYLVLGCSSTKIPDSVTEIGYDVCKNCTELTELVLPSSVTTIEDGTFEGCTGLTKVEIPDSVEEILDWAFAGCYGLTELVISDSVRTIWEDAFLGCSGLTSIKVSPGNKYFDSREGCNAIIHTQSNCLVLGCSNTKIPSSVTSIDSYAFRGCELTSIDIPDSVTEIGECAFADCSELKEVKIPSSVITIEAKAFEDCTGLTELVIPDSVTEIGEDAFKGCTGLTSIKVSPDNKCFDSREDCNAIIDTQNNMLLYGCKNTKIPSSVTSIGPYAFCGCELTSIDIPDSVTEIGGSAFSSCSGLTELVIPDSVTKIGKDAFTGCAALTKLVIPSSVTTLYVFNIEGCAALTKLVIPSSVTTLYGLIIGGCTGLTELVIPASFREIGRSVFNSWSNSAIIEENGNLKIIRTRQ